MLGWFLVGWPPGRCTLHTEQLPPCSLAPAHRGACLQVRRLDLKSLILPTISPPSRSALAYHSLYLYPASLPFSSGFSHPKVEVAAAQHAINLLGGDPATIVRVASHSKEGQRTAVVVAKRRPTPAVFPRPTGTPNKSPL
jgi:hypothetical protein